MCPWEVNFLAFPKKLVMHMLDRGLNALRMYPVPADVRRLMYRVKHAQGVDITRIFCGLNEVRNIIPSIKYAKEAGCIAISIQ